MFHLDNPLSPKLALALKSERLQLVDAFPQRIQVPRHSGVLPLQELPPCLVGFAVHVRELDLGHVLLEPPHHGELEEGLSELNNY